MAGLEVNSVNAAQGANGAKELKPQEEQKIGTVPVGQGYGAASGGGQSEDVKLTNTYGKDFANFANFKGNDKNDAMRITTSAYNTVKKQYMQLQHEYPDVVVNFEPMPDPQKCGKKREGFFNYQQQLDVWKDTALQQINDAREKSTVEVVGEGVGAINGNTNEKAAMNANLTASYGEANLKATKDGVAEVNEHSDKNTEKVIANDNSNARSIKRTVNARADRIEAGQKALSSQMDAGFNSVNKNIDGLHEDVNKGFEQTNKNIGDLRKDVNKGVKDLKAGQKQNRAKVQAEADRVIDTLDPVGIKRAVKGVRDMAVRAGKSVGEFISQNPNVLVPGLGIPLWAARKLISQM